MSPRVTCHLACAVEGSYDMHSAVLLRSAAVNRGDSQLHVHYLHGPEFPRRSMKRIELMLDRLGVRVTFYRVPVSWVAGLPVNSEFTAAMWYRIFLPEVTEAARVLYVDVDAIVADTLAPLWSVNLRGKPLGAVRNVFMPHHLHRPAELGLAGTYAYFNSGVLLMDLDEMRRTNATAELQQHASRRGEQHEWPDQDTLNLVFEERWEPLHPRWNVMNSMRFPFSESVFEPGTVEEARRSPAIRHFEGPDENKPWHQGCDRDNRDLYFKHRRETPWRDTHVSRPRERRLWARIYSVGRRTRPGSG